MKSDTNLVIATLIATVTFTAALAPPGGYGDDGKMILRDHSAFRWFQTFNLTSFLLSMTALLQESILAFLGSNQESIVRRLGSYLSIVVARFTPGSLTVVSLYGMLLAFATGVQAGLTVPEKSLSVDPFLKLASLALVFLAMAPTLKQSIVDLKKILKKLSGS